MGSLEEVIVIKGGSQEAGVEFFSYMSKLLKADIWDKAMKAVNNEDLQKFREICEDALIPKEAKDVCDDIPFVMYKMLRAGEAEYPTMYVWP